MRSTSGSTDEVIARPPAGEVTDLDAGLLEAWRAGDGAAGDALVARYFDRICRFFRSKLGDDVDDLVQGTFLDCLHGLGRIGEAGFRAYLFGIARNRLCDRLRRHYRDRAFDPLTSNLVDSGTTPSSRVFRSQRQEALAHALRHLPVDHQIVLELAYWEGMTGPEIAAVIGAPPNTVRGRLARARDELRAALAAVA